MSFFLQNIPAISLFVFVALTRISLQTRYPSLDDYERIDAAMDNDEEYSKLLKSIIEDAGGLPVDQFYRVIQTP